MERDREGQLSSTIDEEYIPTKSAGLFLLLSWPIVMEYKKDRE